MAGDPYWNEVVFANHFDGANGSTNLTDVLGNTPSVRINSTISTSQSKFGGSSLAMPLGNYYVKYAPGAPDTDFGAGDWTIDFFVYLTRYTTYIFRCGGIFCGTDSGTLSVALTGDLNLYLYSLGTLRNAGWKHVALERYGTNFSVYLDGVNVSSNTIGTDPISYSGEQDLVFNDSTNSGYGLAGYLDEFRITKGVARFKGAFTVPTEAFPEYYEAPAVSNRIFWN